MGGGAYAPERHYTAHLVIVVPFPEPKALLAALRCAHPAIHITFFDQTSWPVVPSNLYKSATALCTWSLLPDDPQVHAPRLKWVHLLSARTNWLSSQTLHQYVPSIQMTTSNGASAPDVARWALTTWLLYQHEQVTLNCHRNGHKATSQHDIFACSKYKKGAAGKRVGILGYDSIGRQVAHLAKSLGMHVVACTAPTKDLDTEQIYQGYTETGTGDASGTIPIEWFSGSNSESLHSFLRSELDWLVVTLPLTQSTHKLLGAGEFQSMSRKHTYMSVITDGPVFAHNELVSALRNGSIQGAALNLTDGLNLSRESPLWNMSNVTIAPKADADAILALGGAFDVLETNLCRLEQGKKLLNLIDRVE